MEGGGVVQKQTMQVHTLDNVSERICVSGGEGGII